MALLIRDIKLYRDGGSIEFVIECDGSQSHVWLNTPFRGEPRALIINHEAVSPGSYLVVDLLSSIETWFSALPRWARDPANETLAHKGPFYVDGAAPEWPRAIDISRVLHVHDYVSAIYNP